MNSVQENKFQEILSVVLGIMVGLLISIPAGSAFPGGGGAAATLGFTAAGGLVGYRRRKSRSFFYFLVVCTLLLVSILCYTMLNSGQVGR